MTEKLCAACGAEMARKRFSSGTLEDSGCFARRKYCNRKCMAYAMKKALPTRSAIGKRLASLRKPSCEFCGTSEGLSTHHKDRNWRNNAPLNLMTLCSSCHTSLHHSQGDIVPKKERLPCFFCEKPSYRLGLCCTHLTRFKRHGSPLLVKRRSGASWLLVEDCGFPNGQGSIELQVPQEIGSTAFSALGTAKFHEWRQQHGGFLARGRQNHKAAKRNKVMRRGR